MPTYDYSCSACDHALEVFQGIHDDKLVTCPECGSDSLERHFGTGAGIVFKGSGFYETDYRSDAYKKAAKADSSPSDAASSSGDSSSGPSKTGKAGGKSAAPKKKGGGKTPKASGD